MDLQLAGKRALVAGSSSGIGAGIAQALAAEGAHVVVHGRDARRIGEVAAAIRDKGGIAHTATGDLTSDSGAAAVAHEATGQAGGIDILVNVTGGVSENTATWDNTSLDLWAEQYQLNTLSAVRMIRHVVPGMKRQGWGRIIQIGSIASAFPLAHQVPAYCAAKASLPVLAVSLAKTLAQTGITINTVTLGYVATPLLRQYAAEQPGNEGRSWAEIEPGMVAALGITVGRFGLPADVAAMVAFLASPVAAWINGSNFRVDGGMCGFVD